METSTNPASNPKPEFLDTTSDVSSVDEYLFFSLWNETFATPLLGVREVVETQEPVEVPHTSDHFKGIINIRGEIVGVLDLGDRLGRPRDNTNNETLLVFQSNSGALAIMVDRVIAVETITEEEIASVNNQNQHQLKDFILGYATKRGTLITLIDLHDMINNDSVISEHIEQALGGTENSKR